MIGFAHFIDNALAPAQPILIGVALVLWLFGAISFIRARRRTPWGQRTYPPRAFFYGLAGFVGIIAAEFVLAAVIKQGALEEIRPILTAHIEAVTVNNMPIPNAGMLIEALRAMHSTMGHHSHPTTRFQVRMQTSSGVLVLDLGRDSGDPTEYWVYYPGFRATQSNDIGHAFTTALDGQ